MSSLLSTIAKMATDLLAQTSLYWIFAFAVSLILFERSNFLKREKSDIPRIGPAPGEPPGVDGGFVKNGIRYVQEGYEKVRTRSIPLPRPLLSPNSSLHRVLGLESGD